MISLSHKSFMLRYLLLSAFLVSGQSRYGSAPVGFRRGSAVFEYEKSTVLFSTMLLSSGQ